MRICLDTTKEENPNKIFLFSKILSDDCDNIIKQNCIPGNNILDNFYVTNYYFIKKHLNTYQSSYGAYVCTCGLYYDVKPCGFPIETSICSNCGEKIGAGIRDPKARHPPLVQRTGHYRIFKNIEQKKEEFNKFGDNDTNIPNMILEDYKKKIIEPIEEKAILGINKISKTNFINQYQLVRKLSHIGYRLLNFILYSHLFYANCLHFLSDENMKEYICEEMSCLEMIITDWNYLKNALQSKNIYKFL